MTDGKAASPEAQEAQASIPPAVDSTEGAKTDAQDAPEVKPVAKDTNGAPSSQPEADQPKESIAEKKAADKPIPVPKDSTGNEDSDNPDDDLNNNKKRGRPPGSKNGSKRVATHASAPPDNQGPPPAQPGKRQRARPKRFDDYLSTDDIPDPEPEKDREVVKPTAPVAMPQKHTSTIQATGGMGGYSNANPQYPPTVAPAAAQYAAGPAATYQGYTVAGYGSQLPPGYAPAFPGYGAGLQYDPQSMAVIRPSNSNMPPAALPLGAAAGNPALQLLLLNQQQLFKQQ